MQNIRLDTITQAVINHGNSGKSHPRLYEIYTSLVRHLHEFVREVNLTESELQQGRNFLNCASHHTQEIPTGEIHLLTDILGLSELVELLNDANRGTESNLEGPLYVPNAHRVGTALVRTFTLSENRVTLSRPPVLSNGVETVFELVWARI